VSDAPGDDDSGPSGALRERLQPLLDRARPVLARLVDASAQERLVISVAALAASLLVGGAIVMAAGLAATCQAGFRLGGDQLFVGPLVFSLPTVTFAIPGGPNFCYNPLDVYYHLFVAPFLACNGEGVLPFGGFVFGCEVAWFNVALMLKETTLLVFTGLSVAVAFRAGLFNIGTQGQMVAGALATALAVLAAVPYAPEGVVGAALLLPLGLLAGTVVGGLYGAIPGALKAYADANEVITTIMLNFVAIEISFYLVKNFFQDPDAGSVATESLPSYAQLRPLLGPFEGSSFAVLGLVAGLALVVAVYYLLFNTAFGYDLRTSGLQPAAAAYGGVDARRMVVTSMTISGALGGLGGAVYVLMVLGRWRTGIPPLGFDGITVSILAGNNPIGVVLAAALFGTMKSGSISISFALGVPKQLVGVLRGLVILFVAMPEFFRMVGARYGLGEAAPAGTAAAADGGDVEGEAPGGGGADGDGPDTAGSDDGGDDDAA
jgi:ABC-type uncharacterized transport system permease subunit